MENPYRIVTKGHIMYHPAVGLDLSNKVPANEAEGVFDTKKVLELGPFALGLLPLQEILLTNGEMRRVSPANQLWPTEADVAAQDNDYERWNRAYAIKIYPYEPHQDLLIGRTPAELGSPEIAAIIFEFAGEFAGNKKQNFQKIKALILSIYREKTIEFRSVRFSQDCPPSKVLDKSVLRKILVRSGLVPKDVSNLRFSYDQLGK